MTPKTPAVFLDRDGVIIREPPHYPHRLDQIVFYDDVIESIKYLNDLNYPVIIVTNQSGIARGMFTETDVRRFHSEMLKKLNEGGASITTIYYCPHHPEGNVAEYRCNCGCRKPLPGMLFLADSDHNIDLKNSFIIGDKVTDLLAGRAAGCKTILVRTGHGRETIKIITSEADYVAKNLFDAVMFCNENRE